MRWACLVLALLSGVASAERSTTFGWDAHPDWPGGTTVELCGNGDVCADGITETQHTLVLPVNPGDVIEGRARAIPPVGYQCGEPPTTDCNSDWATVAQTWPAGQVGVWASKQKESILSTVTVVQTASNNDGGSNVSATFGSTPTAGNLLLAQAASRLDNTNPTISGTGWTRLFFSCYAVSGGDCGTVDSSQRRTLSLFYKVAGASEPTTITISNINNAALSLVELSTDAQSGFASMSPIVYATNNSGTSSVTTLATGTTSSVSGASEYLLVGMLMARNSDPDSPTGEASWSSSSLSDNFYVPNTGYGHRVSTNIAFAMESTGGTKASTGTWPNSIAVSTAIAVFGIGAASAESLSITENATAGLSHHNSAAAASIGADSAIALDLQAHTASMVQSLVDAGIASDIHTPSARMVQSLSDSAVSSELYSISAKALQAFVGQASGADTAPTQAQAIARLIESVLSGVAFDTQTMGAQQLLIAESASASDIVRSLALAYSSIAEGVASADSWVQGAVALHQLSEAAQAGDAVAQRALADLRQADSASAIESILQGARSSIVLTDDAIAGAVILTQSLSDNVAYLSGAASALSQYGSVARVWSGLSVSASAIDVSNAIVQSVLGISESASAQDIIETLTPGLTLAMSGDATSVDTYSPRATSLSGILSEVIASLAIGQTARSSIGLSDVASASSYLDFSVPGQVVSISLGGAALDEARAIANAYMSFVDSVSASVSLASQAAAKIVVSATAAASSRFSFTDVADAVLQRIALGSVSVSKAIGGVVGMDRAIAWMH